ncbi:hypothetical protein ASPVEDRAFT_29648 [Aspergillus versicolor CBS 583.65]|uniref:Uncharacterized protein n=1 Tax=Aspergillus versicolor CBS 583.65 TaxID=1036611 RepID=A0A1L9PNJ8_ASPVE|nr:uncharacterized protein ASPVEDRAFT_29648 [Aspergillus versicolor CBS 583.65]OJJ03117.1 hypothetical protein ASPVEDRAFT_29648 [Aspergillus versicolor CBS 583.65]
MNALESFALPEDQSTTDSASPEHVATPVGAVTSPKSDTAYPTPSSSSGRITQRQPIDIQLSTDSLYPSLATTPMGPATPFGSNATPSSYPTPSSYVESPPAEESRTLQEPRIPSQKCSKGSILPLLKALELPVE